MKTKLLATILIFTMLLPTAAFALPESEADIAALLSELNIMKGDPDGSLRLDDLVTRAEFSKVAIAASAYRNSVAENMTISPFKDVSYQHWAAAYIKLAVSNKLVTGYPDATFRPETPVLYEEAVTIVLKLLGYTDEDFGDSWPYGQTGLAANLDLDENVSASVGQNMTRRDVMNLIYNLLNTDSKGTQTAYIETMNYKIEEDVILIATAQNDSAVGSGYVSTSAGSYKITGNFNQQDVGKKGDVILKNGNELVRFVPGVQTVASYPVYQVLDGDLVVLDNGRTMSLDVDDTLTVYNKSTKTTLQALMPQMTAGDTITLYKNETGILDYAFVDTEQMEGPYTVKSSNWQAEIGMAGATTIMRDGVKTTADAIEPNDVLYYSKSIGTVWAYSKKVTGIYESASPNKDMPTSVTVSGVTYTLEGIDAYNALSSNGSYQFGDTVTLLLGKDGQIADVLASSGASASTVGYLIETGKKDFTDGNGNTSSSYYIKLADTAANVVEYASDRNYENYINQVATVTFEDGKAKLAIQNSQSSVFGKFDGINGTLGKYSLASGVEILDVSTTDSWKASLYCKVYPQRLDGVTLSADSILYCEKNERDEITKLVLNNVTGDMYQYGIVLSANEAFGSSMGQGVGSISATYKFDIGGTVNTAVTSGVAYRVESGQVARFVMDNGMLSGISKLEKLEGAVSEFTDTSITIGGRSYPLSDQYTIYEKADDYSYLTTNRNAIDKLSDYRFTAYYDKAPKNGGRVRVIVVQEKK